MKFVSKTIFIFFVVLSLSFSHLASQAYAANSCTLSFGGSGADQIFQIPGETVTASATNVIFNDLRVSADSNYHLGITAVQSTTVDIPPSSLQNGTLSGINISSAMNSIGIGANDFSSHNVVVNLYNNTGGTVTNICTGTFYVQRLQTVATHCDANSFQLAPVGGLPLDSSKTFTVPITSSGTSGFVNGGLYPVFLERTDQTASFSLFQAEGTGDQLTYAGQTGFGPYPAGTYQIVVRGAFGDSTRYCVVSNGTMVIADATSDNTQAQATAFILCNQAAGSDKQACINCVGQGKDADGNLIAGNLSDPNAQHYWTAFGCIQTSTEGIVTSLIRVGLGISGGFVLISILYGAFLLTTSSGEPKRVQEGQEMVTSAIMGLVFVIFSIIILRFIGVSILQIPGFGK